MTPQPPIPADLLVVAGHLYRDGFSIREIAADIGYSYGATRNGLLRAGVALRRRGQRTARPSPALRAAIWAEVERALANPASLVTRERPTRKDIP